MRRARRVAVPPLRSGEGDRARRGSVRGAASFPPDARNGALRELTCALRSSRLSRAAAALGTERNRADEDRCRRGTDPPPPTDTPTRGRDWPSSRSSEGWTEEHRGTGRDIDTKAVDDRDLGRRWGRVRDGSSKGLWTEPFPWLLFNRCWRRNWERLPFPRGMQPRNP